MGRYGGPTPFLPRDLRWIGQWFPVLQQELRNDPRRSRSADRRRSVGADTFFKGGRFVAGLKADADLAAFVPSYAFATPVFGGQLAVSMMSIVGRNRAGIDATADGAAGQ